MTTLELVLQALTNPQTSDEPLKYPFPLNPDPIVPTLKPDPENPNPSSLVHPLTGFEISALDSDLIEFHSKFFKKLKHKLKCTHSLSSSSFIEMLNSFLETIGEKRFGGVSDVGLKGEDDEVYTCKLFEKFGSFVGKDVMRLVIEGCFSLEHWKILETLIVNNLIDYGLCSDLLDNLVCKSRSELICLCVRCFTDLGPWDLCRVLRYFLSPSKEATLNMGSVRKEWESEGLLAIEKASDKKVNRKKLELAKEACVLLMIAYDGFSSPELCLHFLLSSSNVDEVAFSSAISKLNAEEMMALIRYLSKWLRKYERFPQAITRPKALATLGLNMCKWVPKLEDVVKCLGVVVDEHFSSLVLHSKFHEELKAIEGVVSSLVSEGRLHCSIANLIEILKPEVVGA